jgi:hypothetical protein
VKKSLRKRQQNLKMKSTDEGAGDLVPWSFQTYRLWCHPSSKFNDPTMYNAIAGELFGRFTIAHAHTCAHTRNTFNSRTPSILVIHNTHTRTHTHTHTHTPLP